MPVLLQSSFAPLLIAPAAFLIPNLSRASHGRPSDRNRDYCRQMRRCL
ncbi:hypothetical protein [Methylobacter sp.]